MVTNGVFSAIFRGFLKRIVIVEFPGILEFFITSTSLSSEKISLMASQSGSNARGSIIRETFSNLLFACILSISVPVQALTITISATLAFVLMVELITEV
jgi:hypothetical protein